MNTRLHEIDSARKFEATLREVLGEQEIKKLISSVDEAEFSPESLISALKSAREFRIGMRKQPNCSRLLEELCNAGCREAVLIGEVWRASIAALDEPVPLFDNAELSMPQLERLIRDLLSTASRLRRINQTLLNPKYDLQWAPLDPGRDPLRELVAKNYDSLPQALQLYAVHLEHFFKVQRALLRRLTVSHCHSLNLLRYVHLQTGRPRYEVVAELLAAGFSTLAGEETEVPKSFTAEALTKQYQRTRRLDKKRKNIN